MSDSIYLQLRKRLSCDDRNQYWNKTWEKLMTRQGAEGAFGCWIHLKNGHMYTFTLRKFIKLYSCDLCTFIYQCYTSHFSFFWPCCVAYPIFNSLTRSYDQIMAVKAPSPNHQTARESPTFQFFFFKGLFERNRRGEEIKVCGTTSPCLNHHCLLIFIFYQ